MTEHDVNDDRLLWNARPRPAPQPQPGELIDEFYCERNHTFYRVELRDRGKWGVEAQILDPVDLVIGQRFSDVMDGERRIPARESAIAWAKDWRAFIEEGDA